MPKTKHSRVSITLLQSAYISAIHSHPFCQSSLRQLCSQPQPPHIVAHKLSHVL